MSNYTKSTNFATKDALPSGDPLKIVKGTEIDTEFNNIATAVATKLDITSLYPVGSVYINASDSTSPASLFGFGTWAAFGAGRVLVGFNSSNALFDAAEETGGSYDATLVSHTHTGTTNSAGSHNHSVNDPGHFHGISDGRTEIGSDIGSQQYRAITGTNQSSTTNTTGISLNGVGDHQHSFTTASSGSSATNANIQPYITVYMWKRTA
jgi:hypothetical protein